MSSYHLCKEDYDEVKSRLSMRQVAEHYGRRILRNNICICPFHDDTRPSMKLYDKSFYCWSCKAGGDLITYTGRLYELNNEDACRQLIHDFALPMPEENPSYRVLRERQQRQKRLKERDECLKHARVILTLYFGLLAESSRDINNSHFEEAMQELDYVEYRLQCLQKHPDEFYKDKKAVNKVGTIERRIIGWYK